MITAGFSIFLPGVIVLVLMLLLMRTRSTEEANWRLLAETPTTPIAQVPGPGLVELQGRVVASDQGTIVSPASGRPVVTYRIDVSQRVSSGSKGGSTLRSVLNERDRREFWLDDGSGRRAWITPHEASVVLPTFEYRSGHSYTGVTIGGTPTTQLPMTPQLEAWIMQRTGRQGTYVVVERVIAEGDPLYVLGQAYYHEGVLVLRSQPPQHRLLMSTMNEQELFNLYSTRAKTRQVLFLISLAVTCVGVLLIALGIVL